MAVVYNHFEPISISEKKKIRVQNLQNMFKAQKNWKRKNIDSLRQRRQGSVFFSDFDSQIKWKFAIGQIYFY